MTLKILPLLKANPPSDMNQVLMDQLIESDNWVPQEYDLADRNTRNRFGYKNYNQGGPVKEWDDERAAIDPEVADATEVNFRVRMNNMESNRARGFPFGAPAEPYDTRIHLHQHSFDPDDYSNTDTEDHYGNKIKADSFINPNPNRVQFHKEKDANFWNDVNMISEPTHHSNKFNEDIKATGEDFDAAKARSRWQILKRSEAAFMNKSTGKIIKTGSVHDLLALPDGIGTDLENWIQGFVTDNGKFVDRSGVEPNSGSVSVFDLRKHTDHKTWLSTHVLAKMAVNPKSLKAIANANDLPGGHSHVDDSQEEQAHPSIHEADVANFRANIVASPKYVKKDTEISGELQGITRKTVFTGPDGNSFLIKPYHEKLNRRVSDFQKWPIQGWAEMTNQALFHAAGIGDLHHKVHVSNLPHEKQGQVVDLPALVVHMNKDMGLVGSYINWTIPPSSPKLRSSLMRIAAMDFLTCNKDRHSGNLLIRPKDDAILGIDHGRNFQYYDDSEDNTNLHEFINVSGFTPFWLLYNRETKNNIARSYEDTQSEWNKHVFNSDWWGKHKEAIDKTLKERLKLIKDKKLREHIYRNYKIREDLFNDYTKHGLENFGDEWHKQPVPVYKYGEKAHYPEFELYPEEFNE